MMARDPSTDIAIPLPPRISLSEFAIIHRFLADIVKRRIDFRLSLVVSVDGGLEQYDQARNILRPLYSAQPITSATVALTPTYEDIYEVVLKIGAAGESFTNKGVRSKTELSSATVSRALCELLRAGIIQRTRHVGLHFAEGGEEQLRRIIDGRLQKIAFLMHGAPGSGKSSYAETLGIAIVSRDKVRRIARGKNPYATEDTVWKDTLARAHRYLQEKGSVVVDATFANPERRAEAIKLFKLSGARIVVYQFTTSLEECIRRNALRSPEDQIPDAEIEKRYNRCMAFPPIAGEGGIDEVIRI